MRAKHNKLYSLPMLGRDSDNYKTSSFITSVQVNKDIHTVNITMQSELKNAELEELLESGHVSFCCHVECPQTSFRRAFQTNNTNDTFSIDDICLNGTMEIKTYLVVTKYIEDFTSKDLSDSYNGIHFSFTRGLVIGIGSCRSFFIQKDEGEFSDSPSIFSIVLDTNKKHTKARIELTDHKIQICLPGRTYNDYKMMSHAPQFMEVLHSMLLVPALMKVLTELQDPDNALSYQDSRWYRSLNSICCRNGKTLVEFAQTDDPFIKAQELLRNPLVKGLQKLTIGGDNDED